jgi:hypothetical protein
MRFKEGHIWRCLNDACGARIVVTRGAKFESGANPRCCCGSIMKMPYSQPRLQSTANPQEVRRLFQQLAGGTALTVGFNETPGDQ